jgi:cytochrome c556
MDTDRRCLGGLPRKRVLFGKCTNRRRTHMLRVVAIAAALAVGATAVWAQNLSVIKQRRDVMAAIATASSGNFKMSKGEVPFDLPKIQARLKTMQEEAAKFKALFPNDSKTGGETAASAKIWQGKAEFEKAADTLLAEIKSASAAIKDEATLKAEYPKVARSCGNCHKTTDGFAPSLAESFKRLKQ